MDKKGVALMCSAGLVRLGLAWFGIARSGRRGVVGRCLARRNGVWQSDAGMVWSC